MSSPAHEREELHHLVDALSGDEVRTMLTVARQIVDECGAAGADDDLAGWVGTMDEGPHFSAQVKDILGSELGQARS